MLVLSRKVGEGIVLGDQIRITVVRVSGGGVRLGIEAPENLVVVREELYAGALAVKSRSDGSLGGASQSSSSSGRRMPK